jgi:carboxylate-amine ligase
VTANAPEAPDARVIRQAFDAAPELTVGLEDEVMLLAPDSLELLPVASQLLGRLAGDARFKLELPASQLEIVTPVATAVGTLREALLQARRDLAARGDGLVRLAAGGVHPFSCGLGELNQLPVYEHTFREYGQVAERQLVCALQVHIAVGDAERALSVYNAARSYLPLLAALGANAPVYEGRDTGLASVRPKLSGLLPRQGIPPAIASWEELAETFHWGRAAGFFPEPRTWWWELRPHVRYGTLEFRVPDAQTTVDEAIALAALVQALVAWLGERHAGGERLEVAPSWRIEENRWSACRYGVGGTMADLCSGAPESTSELLYELIETLTPFARRLGGGDGLSRAGQMVAANGAARQRRVFELGGPMELARWLAERFLFAGAG